MAIQMPLFDNASGKLLWDNATGKVMFDDHCCCTSTIGLDCGGQCNAGQTPATLFVTFPGDIVDAGSEPCQNCAAVSGMTFPCTQNPAQPCLFTYSFNPALPCCVSYTIQCFLNAGVINITLLGQGAVTPPCTSASNCSPLWQVAIPSMNCLTSLNGLSVPYVVPGCAPPITGCISSGSSPITLAV